MALPIKPPPVLTGKAAEEFLEKVRNFKDPRSKEEVQRLTREWTEYFAKQDKLYVP